MFGGRILFTFIRFSAIAIYCRKDFSEVPEQSALIVWNELLIAVEFGAEIASMSAR